MGVRVEKAAAKRQAFLEAALRVVEKSGVASLSSHSIARELGVSQPSFYYYFPTQSEFYQQLMGLLVSTNRRLVSGLLGDAPTAWRGVCAYVGGNLRWAEEYPAQADVLVSGFFSCGVDPAVHKVVVEALRGGEQKVYGFIAEGFTEGELAPIVPAKQAAYLLHKAFLGGWIDVNSEKVDRKARREAVEHDMIELARHLLRPKNP